ncbi:MAG: hypothetical protein R6V21_08975 [Pelovirga sp.]
MRRKIIVCIVLMPLMVVAEILFAASEDQLPEDQLPQQELIEFLGLFSDSEGVWHDPFTLPDIEPEVFLPSGKEEMVDE